MAAQQQPTQRRKGPIGAVIGLIGTGVGAATEYHQHRKQRKAAHEASLSPPATEDAAAGPSSRPQSASRWASNGAPPAYAEEASTSERRLDAGRVASDDKKTALDDDSDTDSTDSELGTPEVDDEEAWQLDEVAASTEPPSYEAAIGEDTSEDALVRDTLSNHKDMKSRGELPLPVILPQRRPRNKARGFVRAYSPVLEDVGIDQETFLKFLKNFHKSSQASPFFNAVTIAANIVGFVPEVTAMAVSISLQVVAGVGKAIDGNRNTNKFLDRMNDELFKPAGCYAFILKYKTDAEVAKSQNSLLARLGIGAEQVDFNTAKAVARYDPPTPSDGQETPHGLTEKMKKIRLVSGTTRGSAKLVEAAPLIYPEIDAVIYSGKDGEETFKDRAKDAGKFMARYMDRRSQIKYAQQNPDSSLNVPEGERGFASKHADPNHPMYNNGIVGLLSGGYLAPRDRKAGRRAARDAERFDRRESRHEQRMARHERRLERRYGPYLSEDQYAAELQRREDKHERKMARRYGPPVSQPDTAIASSSSDPARGDYFNRTQSQQVYRGQRRQKDGVIGMVRKVLQEDVLYLMIVPMPSEEELVEARAAVAAAKAK